MERKNNRTRNITLTGMFFAMGVALPFLTGQIPSIGKMLLPMHIPVYLCAFICGWQYAMPMAFVLPLFRSFVFGVPTIYPDAIAIAVEMAVYGLVAGLVYGRSKWKCLVSLYRALVVAMIAGRVARIAVQIVLMLAVGSSITASAIVSVVALTSLPGIAIQLVLIPTVMVATKNTKVRRLKGRQKVKVREQE